MPRFRILSNISLATRLSLVALVVTLVSLAVTATVGLVRGSDLADEVIDDRLVTVSASRASEVAVNLTAIQREIASLASSPATRRAIVELGDAVNELDTQAVNPTTAGDLTEYYLSDVVPRLEDVRGERVGASFLVPDDPAAITLQAAYTVPQTDEDGTTISPELVLDPGDGSAYSAAHPAIHQTYGPIAAKSGFDDLFLIDARNGAIVYSVRKRTDFATSLDSGPYSGSALARLVDGLGAGDAGSARLTDLSAYGAAFDHPTAFVASPVVDDGRTVGYLAAALSVDLLDAMLSGDGSWEGYGETGETYIVGGDGIMRSTARSYAETPVEFMAAAREPGPAQLTEAQRDRISATGTTALVQSVDRRMIDAADAGPGVADSANYQGSDVRTAFRQIPLDDVGWTILTDVRRSELNDPIENYARQMLFAVALFIVVVTFVAVRWSDRLAAPIRSIGARLRHVRSDPNLGGPPVEEPSSTNGPGEYEDLSANVAQMLDRLRDRRAAVEARASERTELLRQFLPAAIAQRSEEGDGEVLDHVSHASVVVLTFEGVGGLVGDRPEQEVRDLLADIVDEVDALAADLGLERIKLTGATYYAVCGVSRPSLDHAPRSVTFALAARDLVNELTSARLAVRGGVAAGPVSVGLVARSALVYDVWGETVSTAEELAHRAQSDTIMVSQTVRAQLPDDFVTSADPDSESVAVTARIVEQGAGT